MDLYFLRHGQAGQYGDPKYKDDSLRPLTAEGKKKLRQEALGMKALGLTFDAVLSSPYVRARQTAEIIIKYGPIPRRPHTSIHLTNNLLPPASIKKLLKEIQTKFPSSKNLLLVGHEPHLTETISGLLKCKNPLLINFKKGGLCCLTLTSFSLQDSAILQWLLTPGQLNALKPDL